MKKIFTLFFILCVILAGSQNLANSLQACYPFDGNSQNYASSGSSLDGTLTNVASTSGHTGNANTAYSLNGTIGSYIELPDNPHLKSDSVFFSGWFRIDSLPNLNASPSLEYMVYTSNGCTSNFEAYSLHLSYDYSANHYAFCVTKCGSDCGIKPQIYSIIAPVTGNWYHVCFYIDNSVMKLYVNGAFQSSVTHSVQFGYQTGKKVYLGVTNESNFNYPFKGAVDNVRFYHRELTQQEITQLYTQDPACDASSGPPVSSFSVSGTQICRGASITFTDMSSNTPTSWSWQFPGANPASSTLHNPTVSFPTPGIYTVSLVASNAAGAGNTSVQTITVSNCVSIAENNAAATQIKLYPNPATNRVYIENLGDNAFIVNDLLGKPVKYVREQIAGNVCEVNLENTVPGIYFIKIMDTQGNLLSNIKLVLAK